MAKLCVLGDTGPMAIERAFGNGGDMAAAEDAGAADAEDTEDTEAGEASGEPTGEGSDKGLADCGEGAGEVELREPRSKGGTIGLVGLKMEKRLRELGFPALFAEPACT